MTEMQFNELIDKEFDPLFKKYAARIDCVGLPQKEMLELLQDCRSFANPLLTLQCCGTIKWADHLYGAHEEVVGACKYFYIKACPGDRVRFTCWFSVKSPGKQTTKTKDLLRVEGSQAIDP